MPWIVGADRPVHGEARLPGGRFDSAEAQHAHPTPTTQHQAVNPPSSRPGTSPLR